MPELTETLLNRLGVAEAMAHRAKATAGRIQQAAAKHHDSANGDLDALGKQIEAAGVGADEDAENRYCRALVARGHMAQAHHLAGLDAARMPEVGLSERSELAASLEKGRISQAKAEAAGQGAMDFEENQHPRAAEGTSGQYKPGEFVPKGEQSDRVEAAAQSAQEDGHPGLAEAHQDLDPKADWKKNGVRAQSFKSWFGDWESDPKNASKVVDDAGEPQETYPFKVYHGTKQRFNTFDPEKLGTNTQHPTAALGFFFTESEVVARTFSGEKLRYEPEKDIRALAREHYGKEYADIHDEETRAKIRQMEKEQPKVVRSEGEPPARSHVLAAYLNLRNPYKMPLSEWMEKFARPFLQKDGKDKVKEAVAETRKKLEADGYDGIILDKSPDFEDRPTNEYSARAFIAFRPEQIKSVDNEGTFDPSNPNMNKAVRSACEANELCRPFVPPDMPRWRGPRPSPNSYLPLNGVEDREKFLAMAKEMATGTWTWDKPLIRCGDQLLTGSHRYAAAQMAGVPLETLDVGDLFKRCGRNFQETWERLAQPYTSWLNNMDAALKTLPPEILALFGIDLG